MIKLSNKDFFPSQEVLAEAEAQGLRPRAGGTHTSRTIMSKDLDALLNSAPEYTDRAGYSQRIVEENCLGKSTVATRRLSYKRLGELYALDRRVSLFRVLRRLWQVDEVGRPLLALLAALARDPLLLATAPAILSLRNGDELPRGAVRQQLDEAVAGRLNEGILDKVLRNTASSWTQSGHLTGRTFKTRQPVQPTPGAISFALWIACQAGFNDTDALRSGWIAVLDCAEPQALQLASEAHRLHLINMSVAENAVTLDFGRLDPNHRSR
ncbi:hypothetical protein [Microvirga lotononidis]|uniref:DUF1819 domain-containing protein n=1 Tax=Microvirga lotononidis TaxID=864069 RepID=I4YVL6_9HYPH|nr:hypothetical protein [Microvirga lotononidis]EIM28008.1 hypothetical protein MicloDRAFT_00045850 [Microvirga lotononidis]